MNLVTETWIDPGSASIQPKLAQSDWGKFWISRLFRHVFIGAPAWCFHQGQGK